MRVKAKTKWLWRAVAAMAATLALSNFLVQFPIGDWLTWGAFSYPAVFLVTDLSNRFGGAAFARRVAYAGFAAGAVISVATSTLRIAAASGGAFLCAQLLDVLIFHRLRNSIWWRAPVISSAIASITDTFLFFALAFYNTGETWGTWAAGDLLAKAAMLAVLILPYRAAIRRYA